MNNIFQERINCWNDTLNKSNLLPTPPTSLKIKFDNNNTYYNKKYEKSNIHFFDMDAIDCCLQYSPNALVLNLADDNFPGGCVSMGSGAQEEALFRRTNYCKSLKIDLYPIKNDEVIYSPDISVIKTNENSGWKLLNMNNLPKISFIACPGIKHPDTITINNEIKLNNNDVEILQNKISTIIQTAIKFNYDTIIFGALGCGAWKNPTKHVAEIFKEILEKYDGYILNYYFAIMSTTHNNYIVRDHNKNGKTIDVFTDVFYNKK
jgi:uncharacterized protein (TIGR02452 family)